MTRRIELADPLALLAELPGGWAQTVIASPPPGARRADTLAVFDELWRVLRDDGTLWLMQAPCAPALTRALCERGWYRQTAPPHLVAAARRSRAPARLVLLTKRERGFYLDAQTLAQAGRGQALAGANACGCDRCACGAVRERARLLRACMFVGTAPLACGACGAPYRRARPGERGSQLRRPTCSHRDPRGRCLVLDPFYRPGGLGGDPRLWDGRSFLGITAHPPGSGCR